jgi:DNA-binding Lrp family transcriptional regulator
MSASDRLDRSIVRATQQGLPLVSEPYRAVADSVGAPVEEVMKRLRRMLADGRVRRIGAVPNHYALGYTANAMSVWDVEDHRVDELGARVGELPFVTHCYRRPRRPPDWPYNLFAMVHGRSRLEVERALIEIRALLNASLRASDVLYSTRILKKTGLRLA